MATVCIAQLTFQDETFLKPVTVAFDQAYASSDGGLPLKALDARLAVTATLAAACATGASRARSSTPCWTWCGSASLGWALRKLSSRMRQWASEIGESPSCAGSLWHEERR